MGIIKIIQVVYKRKYKQNNFLKKIIFLRLLQITGGGRQFKKNVHHNSDVQVSAFRHWVLNGDPGPLAAHTLKEAMYCWPSPLCHPTW